jgi:hypothetical protein
LEILQVQTKFFFNDLKNEKWEISILSKLQHRTYDIISEDLNKDGKVDIIEANTGEYNFIHIIK